MPGFIDTPLLDQVSADSNEPARSRLAAGGFEISPVDDVARAAWDAVHGERVHVPVGKMAKRLSRLARFFPGLIAKQSKKRSEEHTSELPALNRIPYAGF